MCNSVELVRKDDGWYVNGGPYWSTKKKVVDQLDEILNANFDGAKTIVMSRHDFLMGFCPMLHKTGMFYTGMSWAFVAD